MKFLKTFLFTISLTFLSFGVFYISGFCLAAPQLDAPSLSVITGNDNSCSFVGISPELSVMAVDKVYTDIRDGIYETTGYWIEDVDNEAEVTAQFLVTTPNFQNAEWIANKITNGAKSFANLVSENYKFYKQALPQYGSNVYRYFVGTENNGTVSNVRNSVQYITSSYFDNYSRALAKLINDDVVDHVSQYEPFCSQAFEYQPSSSKIVQLEFTEPVYFATRSFTNGNKQVVLITSSDLDSTTDNIFKSGKYIYYGNSYDITGVRHLGYDTTTKGTFTYNNHTYYIYRGLRFNVSGMSGYSFVDESGSLRGYGDFSDYDSLYSYVKNMISNEPKYVSQGFSYSLFDTMGNANQISLILKQLINHWVDSESLKRVETIIREIPISPVIPDGQSVAVPQAQPSAEQLEDLQDLIDTLIADSSKWAEVLPEPEPEPEPEPDPEPIPNNQGTEVPEDFPSTILDPINDSVGGVFDFVSIFEPLFYIFSFSAGLLGLWIVVPFVILFLILFRLLK